ncbi:MAG: S8 family serine peptidase, partial [Planctomyces sp.]
MRRSGLQSLEPRVLLTEFSGMDFVEGELLVQYAPQLTLTDRDLVRANLGLEVAETVHTQAMQSTGSGVLERVLLPAGTRMEQVIELLKNDSRVLFAEPNYRYQPSLISDDPKYLDGSLWGMFGSDMPTASGPAGTTNRYGSNAEAAWNLNLTGSRSVYVGIIDEGIQIEHPDLAPNIWVNPGEIAKDGVDNDGNGYVDDVNGWDFCNNDKTVYDLGQDSHGTHVAGTIGAVGGNQKGVAGVNWAVTMIPCKFIGLYGGYVLDAVKALDYVTDLKTRYGINVVATNNSWGGGGYSEALHNAIIRSAKKDILFVASAGNAADNNDSSPRYPCGYNSKAATNSESAATYDSVISVASITSTGAMSSFSCYGLESVDLGAPGSSVISTIPDSSYGNMSGTSMAAPHVTGAIALFASAQSGRVSAESIRAALLGSTTQTASLAGRTVSGGRLNVYDMVRNSAFIDFNQQVYGPTQTVRILVSDRDSNVNAGMIDSVVVQVHSTSETTPLSLVLYETEVNSGVFSGSVSLGTGTAVQDAVLQVSHGDVISASFAARGLSDTATVDALPPMIHSISALPSRLSAVVSWQTTEEATGRVWYGTSRESLTKSAGTDASGLIQSLNLQALTPSTTWYYRVEAADPAGNTVSSDVYSFTTVAPAPILFVDDDHGARFEQYFQAALSTGSFSFDTWDVAASGASPTASDLRKYPRVIWNTGYDYSGPGTGLSAAEQEAIAGFLNSGGRIFISGQDILHSGVTSEFMENCLKVSSYASDVITTAHTETGVIDSTITAGMSLAVAAPTGFPRLYVDALTPVLGASGILLHGVYSVASPFSAISYRGDYAVGGFGMVFSTVPFESLSTTAAAPNNQVTFLTRVMEYLNGPSFAVDVSAPSGPTTTEAGGRATFKVTLKSKPSTNVTVPITVSDTTEARVSAASLVFTPANWSQPQTVTVTGLNDDVDDGNIPYQVQLGLTVSGNPAWNGIDPPDVALSNLDDDTAGINVGTISGTTTTEAGGAVSFTVRLNSEPTTSVTLPFSSDDTTEGIVSPASVTFTAANWNLPVIVRGVGVDDWIDDGDLPWKLIINPAVSQDPLYSGLNPADFSLLNRDDDTSGIALGAISGTTTSESGGSVSFTVRLTSEPVAAVRIGFTSSDTTEGSVSPGAVTFTAANWNMPVTVTGTGVDDAVYDGNVAWTLVTVPATSTDIRYNGLNPADFVLTNLDNEQPPATKFYVVDDGTENRSFEYDNSGALIEINPLNSGNGSPRGVAMTSVGDRMWVIDANRAVYVYNTSGGLLGSWTLGGLPAKATVEGIATNGTHVWIIDSFGKKIYYYANAATKTSGTQSATSSFSMLSANTNPRDVVWGRQDNVSYLWVVDNGSSADRVFRYTLNTSGVSTAGSSWTISTQNAGPTGIAIDPSDGTMDIWISDSRTDRVYRYADGRTSTAPALASSFALGSANTNPQGLADPPPVAAESLLPGYVSERVAAAPVFGFPSVINRRNLLPTAGAFAGQPVLNNLTSPVSRRYSTASRKKSAVRFTDDEHRGSESGTVGFSRFPVVETVNPVKSRELLDDVFGQLSSSGLSWLN